MFKVDVKRFKAELLLIVAIIVASIILTCSGIFIKLETLEKIYSLCLQIITGAIGLYFTAFTIFVGLGLSPKKLDTSKLINKLKAAGLSDEEVDDFIDQKVISPYKDSLAQASENFKETILIICILFGVSIFAFSSVLVSEDMKFSCSVACSTSINSFLFCFIGFSTTFTMYLIYDSAKFLVNLRKLL